MTLIVLANQTAGGQTSELISILNFIGSITPLNGAIIGAIIGAVVTSVASQVLTTYRNDLNKARRFDAIIKHMELTTDEEIAAEKRGTMLNEIEQELREFYIEEQWLLSDAGREIARDTLREINHYIEQNKAFDGRNSKEFDYLISKIEENSEKLSNERHHVRLRDSWKRYLGRRDAYDNN